MHSRTWVTAVRAHSDVSLFQTDPMLIDRRTLLFGGVASLVVACSSGSKQGGSAGTVPVGPVTSANIDPPSPPNPAASKVPASIAMVGDSITALSKTTIQAVMTEIGFQTITINAEPSRRIESGKQKPTPGLNIVKFIEASKPAPDMWVIALGTNDAGQYSNDADYQALIDDVLAVIPKKAPLVWISTYRHDQVPACQHFNLLVRASLLQRGNAAMGEWFDQVTKNSSILTHDGVHPNAKGILVFADTVRSAIATVLA
ncbi:MAG: hypothetical protein JWM34_4215 [Ilumatobacteraceae bacterium]|nr:hypothetical protein [Ilumatobacteraceae bacterium]